MYEDRIYQLESKVNILDKQVQKLMDCLPTINKKWIRPCELGDLIGVSPISETDQVEAVGASLTLTGIKSSFISRILFLYSISCI